MILHERYLPESVDALVDGLRWFKIGYSWGGVTSLAFCYRDHRYEDARMKKAEGHVVRLHIGLESVDDLIADLDAGLRRLKTA